MSQRSIKDHWEHLRYRKRQWLNKIENMKMNERFKKLAQLGGQQFRNVGTARVRLFYLCRTCDCDEKMLLVYFEKNGLDATVPQSMAPAPVPVALIAQFKVSLAQLPVTNYHSIIRW
jgi:hypothetical protein